MTTGEKIAAERKKLNLTQQEFADKLGVTRQAVSRWEGDLAFPETDTLLKMSELFGCSTDYLLKYSRGNENHENDGRDNEGKDDSGKERRPFSFNPFEWHFEYKSERTVCGLPLVHVNIGVGRKAKGFFAFGLVSSGIFSAGLLSMGVFSFGLLSLGLITLGCLSFGGAAFGAIALGLLALGGVAVGIIAIGGVAVGCYALGGAAIGLFACGGYADGYYVAVGDYAVGRIAFGESTAIGSQISVTGDNYAELKEQAFTAMDELPGFWSKLIELCKNFAQKVMTLN